MAYSHVMATQMPCYYVLETQKEKESCEATLEKLTRNETVYRATLADMTPTIHALSRGPETLTELGAFIEDKYLPMKHALATCQNNQIFYSERLVSINAKMGSARFQADLATYTAACCMEEQKKAQLTEASEAVTQKAIHCLIRPATLDGNMCTPLPTNIEKYTVVSVQVERPGGRSITVPAYEPGVAVMRTATDKEWIVCQIDPRNGELLFRFVHENNMRGPPNGSCPME